MNIDLTPERIARLPIASRIRYREETILLHVARSTAGDLPAAPPPPAPADAPAS